MPTLRITPSLTTAPAGTSIADHCGAGVPSTSTTSGAPVTAIRAPSGNRSRGPVTVTSSPADSSGLPTSRLAVRSARSSMGPDGGTPTSQSPSRPGNACTVVSVPADTTSAALTRRA